MSRSRVSSQAGFRRYSRPTGSISTSIPIDASKLRGDDLRRQMREPAKARSAVAHRISGDGVAGESPQKPRQRHARLQTCEIDPRASVNAESKRKMTVRLARDVQSVRLGELRRIAGGGADAYGDAGIRGQPEDA